MTSSINFNVRPLREDTSKEAMSELDQAKRDFMFYGDSIEKKQIKQAQSEEKKYRRARNLQLKQRKQEERLEELRIENMLNRGDAQEIKPIRSEARGKENKVLKPWLKTYNNVDENITAVPNKLCPYQLVHEGGQFRMEHPFVSKA